MCLVFMSMNVSKSLRFASPSGSLPSRPLFPPPPHKKAQRAHASHFNALASHYTHSYSQAGVTFVSRHTCLRSELCVVWAMHEAHKNRDGFRPHAYKASQPHVYPTQTHVMPLFFLSLFVNKQTRSHTHKRPPSVVTVLFHSTDKIACVPGLAGQESLHRGNGGH